MYFTNLGGPIALIVMMAFMFLLVPWERIQRLYPISFFFGLILATATYHLLPNVFQAWHFRHMDLISPGGIPLFMALAWIPYSVIYFHLLAQYRSFALTVLLILLSAAVPTFFHFLLEINGMVVLQRWPWWGNFFYALIVYNGLAQLVFHSLKPAAKTTVD